MNPFISGFLQIAIMGTFFKWRYLRMYWELRDCKFFWREKVKLVHMKLATLADRPAKLAKWTIFCQKPNFFVKNSWKSNFHKVAGNAIGHTKNFPKCSPSPGDTFWYPACVNTPIRTTIIISQTVWWKIENFSKVKLHRNFSAVNSLEKNSQNFSKKIQKFWKIIFFFQMFWLFIYIMFFYETYPDFKTLSEKKFWSFDRNFFTYFCKKKEHFFLIKN